MQTIGAYFAILFFRLLALVPFPLLYIKSSGFAFVLNHLATYRHKVVDANLKRCFPKFDTKQIRNVRQNFYVNLSDILLEGLKGLHMSKASIHKRYQVLNPEILDSYFQKGQSVICLASHYANWEWGILAVDSQIKHQAISIYKTLSNKTLDRYMLKQRQRFGMMLFAMEQTKQAFEFASKHPSAIILAADQSPSDVSKSILVNFFDETIGFIHGPEAYASKTNTPVLYFDVQRIRRGYYTLEMIPLSDKMTDPKPGAITQAYAHMLEDIVRKKPSDWLWSHRRWKHDYTKHPNYPN
jgi:KDO2-lipid IV(A) lauroyltransferase